MNAADKFNCITCGKLFHPANPDVRLCPDCGGPPEAVESLHAPGFQTRLDVPPTPAPAKQTTAESAPVSLPPVEVQREGLSVPAIGEGEHTADWQEGQTILDTYTISGVLGEGGMGKVYRVHHNSWNIDLAVKCPKGFQTKQQRDDFINEAETWVELGLHPHIVTCYYVRNIDDIPRVFAELVEGGSLTRWIAEKKIVTLEKALDIAIQFAWGLDYAHQQGLVHQDVKPDNVLITPECTAKVTDFGLAKAGKGMTPAYASPEQAEAQLKDVELTPQSDIWSWALSILEMFAGRAFWARADLPDYAWGQVAPQALEHYLSGSLEAAPIPKMPIGLADLLRDCFRTDLASRPSGLNAVAQQLVEIYANETGQPYLRLQPKAEELRADSLNNKALSFLDLKLPEKAREAWQAALQADPLHAESVYNYGLFEWRAARLIDDALTLNLQRVIDSQPNNWRAHLQLAQVHLERGDGFSALQVLSELSSKEETAAESRTLIEQARKLTPNGENSLRIYRPPRQASTADCLALHPDNSRLLMGSGSTLNILNLEHDSWGPALSVYKVDEFYNGAAWLPDERVVFTPRKGAPRIWDLVQTSGSDCPALQAPADVLAGNETTCLAASPDGKLALSGSKDGRVFLWDLQSMQLRQVLSGHTDVVRAVAFGPQASIAFSAGEDGSLRIWDLARGSEVRRLQAGANRYFSLIISPDGRTALAGTLNHVELWDLYGGVRRAIWKGHQGLVSGLAFGPKPGWAVSASRDGTCRLWKMDNGRCCFTLRTGKNWLTALALTPEYIHALSSSTFSEIYSWRFPPSSLQEWPGPAAPFALTRAQASEQQARASIEYEAYMAQAEQAARDVEANDSDRDRALSEATTALQAARSVPGFAREPRALQLSIRLGRYGRRASLAGCWEVAQYSFNAPETRCEAAVFDPCNRWVIAGGYAGRNLSLWSLDDKKSLHRIRLADTPAPTCNLAVTPNGNKVFFGDIHGGLHLLNLENEQERVAEGNAGGNCFGVEISPDGRLGLSCSKDGLFLWDLESSLEQPICQHADKGRRAIFSADGRRIFSIIGGDILAWEIASGKVLQKFSIEGVVGVDRLLADPNGRYLVVACGKQMLGLLDLEQEICLLRIDPPDTITSLALHPGGRWVAAGSYDSLVRIWDLSPEMLSYAAPEPVAVLAGHARNISTLHFAPDGCHLVSGSGLENVLRLWHLDWNNEYPPAQDWHPEAQPYLETFLMRPETSRPDWLKAGWPKLWETLVQAGFGWLRPEGVRRKLEEMAQKRQQT